MTAPPAGISEADWLATPSAVRGLILAQQEEIQQLREQVCAMATGLASLRERIGHTSRNSSKPPSSNGPGFKPPERRKGSGLVGLLTGSFPLSFSKVQLLLDQLLGVEVSCGEDFVYSRGALSDMRQRLSAALEAATSEAHQAAQRQPVAYVVDDVLRAALETGAPTGNAAGGNAKGRRGWLWVMVTPIVTVFLQGLSRSAAAAKELLGHGFAGVVVSDRYAATNHLPTSQRQLCWAHLIRDLTAIAERQGASAELGAELLALQRELFAQWHRWKDGTIDWASLRRCCQPLRLAFEQTLQRVVDLGSKRGETTPWARTVSTCGQLLKQKEALWTFLEIQGIEPTNNAAVGEAFSAGVRALRQAVIHRKISHGVQSAQGALCRGRLLTVVTSLRQQGRDIWPFLEQTWITHHRGGERPSLLPDP